MLCVVKESAYEGQVFGQPAVGAPSELYAEKLRGGFADIESVGFKRGTHPIGMAAGSPFGACATPFGTVEACAYIGERASAVKVFHFEQTSLDPGSFGSDQRSRIREGATGFRRCDFRGHQQGRVVTAEQLLHVVIERRASPAVSEIPTRAAIGDEPFGIAEPSYVVGGWEGCRKVFGGILK